jgi:recombinase
VEGARGEKREFVKRDDLVDIIIQVYHAYDGGLGCISVAKLLHRNNIKSFSGKTWSAGTVQRLLRNEAVIGVYQPHVYIRKGKRVPDGQGKIEGYYPEIISPALFDRVQRTLDAKKNYGKDRRNYGGGQKLSTANLVSGIGWCVCGNKGKSEQGVGARLRGHGNFVSRLWYGVMDRFGDALGVYVGVCRTDADRHYTSWLRSRCRRAMNRLASAQVTSRR